MGGQDHRERVLTRALLISVAAGFALLMYFIFRPGMCTAGTYRPKGARADISRLRTALFEYALRNDGLFPERLEQLLESDDHGGPYLVSPADLLDPWGRPFLYQWDYDILEFHIGAQDDFLLKTLGKDNRVGGDHLDEDLSVTAWHESEDF